MSDWDYDFGENKRFDFACNGTYYYGISMDVDDFKELMKDVLTEGELYQLVHDFKLKNAKIGAGIFLGETGRSYHGRGNLGYPIGHLEEELLEWEEFIGEDDEIRIAHQQGIELLERIQNHIAKRDYVKPSIPGFVYLVYSSGVYKIGKTKQLDSRTKYFSTIMPVEVNLIHSFHSNDYNKAEKKLHNKYAEYRKTGEWFELSEEQVKEICLIKDDEI